MKLLQSGSVSSRINLASYRDSAGWGLEKDAFRENSNTSWLSVPKDSPGNQSLGL